MIKVFLNHLIDEVKEHWWGYLVLILGLLGGLVAFILFSGQAQKRNLAVLFLTVFYFLWGIIHHTLKKDLHFKVILEYLLISLLGLVVFFSLV